MTYIPDSSQKRVTKQRKVELGDGKYKYEPYETDNAYYEGLLKGGNKMFIEGIEYAKKTILSSFFDNLLNYIDEITDEERKSDLKPIMQLLNDNPDKAQILFECIYDWFDNEKNEITIGFIDGMSEEEYKENYIKVFGEESYKENIGGLE